MLDAHIPADRITTGKLVDALVVLIDAVHVDQRLVLTTVEAYHSEIAPVTDPSKPKPTKPELPDGFSSLPRLDWPSPKAVPGPRLVHLRTLGMAFFSREPLLVGLAVVAPSAHFQLAPLESDVVAVAPNATDLERLVSRKGSFAHSTGVQNVEILAIISPEASLDEEVTLIAVTVSTMPTAARCLAPETLAAYNEWKARVLMPIDEDSWCCLVCTNVGGVVRKVGLAIVRPAQFV